MTSARIALVWIVPCLTMITVLSCIPGDSPDDTPGNIPPTEEQEPNGSIDNATPVQWDDLGRALLRGRISGGGQIDEADCFALGPLQAGDRLVLEVRAAQTDLGTILGVFDADGKLFALNRTDPARPESLDPSLDRIVRHDSELYYAVITRAAFSPQVEGDYEIDVRMEGSQAVPVAQGQTILLDFEAARINIPGIGLVQIGAFDAGDIDARYAGQTATVKQWIVATCRQNFARFNVWIRDSDHDPPPEGPYSRVYFGGYDPQGLGMALTGTDPYNADPRDEAIVFTQRFTPDLFTHPPDAQQLGVAIGNITAHEIGHLLGLYHVRDNLALMNTYDAPDYLLTDQCFRSSNFSLYTFAVTDVLLQQDAALLLADTVGLVPPAVNTEIPLGTEPAALVVGDWDGDGSLGLAVADPMASTLWLLNHEAEGGWVVESIPMPEHAPYHVISGDFDDDGLIDLVTTAFHTDSIVFFRGLGDGTFSSPVSFATGGFGPSLAESADFSGNGLPDVALIHNLTDQIAILTNEGNGWFSTGVYVAEANYLSALAACDFDGDGDQDLAYAHIGMLEEYGGVRILLNEGALSFTAGPKMVDNTLPAALIAVDVDHDGISDLVSADIYTDSVVVLINDGQGNFTAPAFYSTGELPNAVAAGDLDGDGFVDLVVANEKEGDISILYNRGDGTFEPQWPYRIGAEPYTLILLDLDSDGDLDVAVANRTAGTIAILLNNGQRHFGLVP